MQSSEISLAVLAGGRGFRMGRPKSLLTIDGKPILQFLLDQWSWPGPKILVTAPGVEHPPGWEDFDEEAVDEAPDEGPLRGVLTALMHSQSRITVVATVDMPAILGEHLQWLGDALWRDSGSMGVMTKRDDRGVARIEPFPSAFTFAAAQRIRDRLTGGERSVVRLLDDPAFAALEALGTWNQDIWLNLNSPEDLSQFLHRSGA